MTERKQLTLLTQSVRSSIPNLFTSALFCARDIQDQGCDKAELVAYLCENTFERMIIGMGIITVLVI